MWHHHEREDELFPVLQFEPATTLNTGNVVNERTIREPRRLWRRAAMKRAVVCLTLVLGIVAGYQARSDQAATRQAGRPEATVEKMDKVGQAFLFDYGELVIGVRYLSDRKLAWEQIKGPEAGLKAEEEYRFAVIRPAVYFIWWQEHDTSVVTQVVDFEKGRVHTTWISSDRKVASFNGKIIARAS